MYRTEEGRARVQTNIWIYPNYVSDIADIVWHAVVFSEDLQSNVRKQLVWIFLRVYLNHINLNHSKDFKYFYADVKLTQGAAEQEEKNMKIKFIKHKKPNLDCLHSIFTSLKLLNALKHVKELSKTLYL